MLNHLDEARSNKTVVSRDRQQSGMKASRLVGKLDSGGSGGGIISHLMKGAANQKYSGSGTTGGAPKVHEGRINPSIQDSREHHVLDSHKGLPSPIFHVSFY